MGAYLEWYGHPAVTFTGHLGGGGDPWYTPWQQAHPASYITGNATRVAGSHIATLEVSLLSLSAPAKAVRRTQ